MKPRQTLTPTMMRLRYHERRARLPVPPAERPRPARVAPLAPEPDRDSVSDWIAHLRFG